MKFILFDIGGLRADHLGCYGYERPTSPVVDRLAREGLRCNAAFSSDATNAGARAAIFSGRFGLETGVVTDGLLSDVIEGHTPVSTQGITAPKPMLPEYLSAHGLHTTAITPFGRQCARWFYTGWHEVYDPWPGEEPSDVEALHVNEVALPWLEQHATQNFFLYLTYNNLYRQADAPLTETEARHLDHLAAYGTPARPDEATFAGHRDLHAVFSPRYHRAPTREAIWKLVHSYNARIRAIDDCVGAVVGRLADLGILDDTVIILTSDHGVLFGECGCYGGHISAHYNCIRVPLIIRAPGVLDSGIALQGLCYTLDLGPTICDMLGRDAPAGYHGASLIGLLEDDKLGGRDYIVSGHGQHTAQRAVVSDGWKLNRTWHGGFWHFADTELYHVKEDAAETSDRGTAEPDLVRALMRKMRQWVDEYRPGRADPLARVACQEPPGFLHFGQKLRARVRRGEMRTPEGYQGRWA